MKLFELFATLGLDTSEFNKGTEDAQNKSDSLITMLGNISVKTAAVAAGFVTLASKAVKAMYNMAVDTATAGDRVDKMSQKLGMSRQAFQEWDYVMGQNGANIDSFGVGMKTLQNAMSQGTEATDKAFTALGINVKEIKDLSPEDALAKTIEAFQLLPAGADRAALAFDLFGKQGQELEPLLNQTKESTDALKQEAHDYGLVMSDELVDNSVKFGDSLDKLTKTFEATKNQLIGDLLPAFTSVFDAAATGLATIQSIADAVKQIFTPPEDSALTKLTNAYTSIIASMTSAETDYADNMADIQARADLAEKYLKTISALESKENLTDDDLTAWQNAVAALVKLYPELQPYIDSETGLFTTNTTSIRDNIKALQDLAKEKAMQTLTSALTEQGAALTASSIEAQAALTKQIEKVNLWQAVSNRAKKALDNYDYLTGFDTVNTQYLQNLPGFLDMYKVNIDGSSTRRDDNHVTTAQLSKWFGQAVSGSYDTLLKNISEAEALTKQISDAETKIKELQTRKDELTAAYDKLYAQKAPDDTVQPVTDSANAATTAVNQTQDAISGLTGTDVTVNVKTNWVGGARDDEIGGYPQATGLSYVPYDNYPALLHKGESVLTRQEAEKLRAGRDRHTAGGLSASTTLRAHTININNAGDAAALSRTLADENTRQLRALGRRV